MKAFIRIMAACAALLFTVSCAKETTDTSSTPDPAENSELPSDALAYATVQQTNAVIESYLQGISDSNGVFWSVTCWWPTKSWIWVSISKTTLDITYCSCFEILPQGTGGKANENVALSYLEQDFPDTTRQQIIDYYTADKRVEKVDSYEKSCVQLQVYDRKKLQ